MSENKIRKALSKMQLSLIELEGEKYFLRSSMSERATQILRLLNLKKPPDFTKTSYISRYIPTIKTSCSVKMGSPCPIYINDLRHYRVKVKKKLPFSFRDYIKDKNINI